MGANASLQERVPGSNQSTLGSYRTAQLSDYDTVVMREKKKKASKFATLRKKLGRNKRSSRNLDYGKALRELTSTWTTRELHSLCDEYESSMALRDLAFLANVARPSSSTILEDLAALYENKYCTDVDLVYEGVTFPAHRAILCVRCALFRELLANYPGYGVKVPVAIRTRGVDVNLFSALLRFLYTGDFGLEPGHLHCLRTLLNSLAVEFGAPNSIDQDLRTLLDTSAYSDAVIVFSSVPILAKSSTLNGPIYRGDGSLSRLDAVDDASFNEVRCHWAILAARSPFFRSLFFRRMRKHEEIGACFHDSLTQIVLDDEIIPRRYARVLLNAIYLDIVDLTFVLPSNPCPLTLSDYQGLPRGRGPTTAVEEAVDLYHIGQFLDFPALSQSCEDIIMESLSPDNLLMILKWSSKPHGSEWAHRQALHFLREEFLQVAHSPVLLDLDKEYLVSAICSDFLQASELDILTAIIKWSEHQLVKRMEEREPNYLVQSSQTMSKKGTKKRDTNDVDLREILADLLPYLRVDHIIPPNGDILTNAIKRGLISSPPSHMIGPDTGYSTACAWVRTRNASLFVKPRLFTPYYEEIKLIIKEQNSRGPEPGSTLPIHSMHACAIPDALYMLDEQSYSPKLSRQRSCSSSTIDIIAGIIPVPDKEILQEMRHREADLSRSKLAQRAYSLLSSDRLAITREIHLRIIREFGFPDSAVEILQGSIDHAVHRHDMCAPLSGMCCLMQHRGHRLFQFPPRTAHKRVQQADEKPSRSTSPSTSRSSKNLEPSQEPRDESPARIVVMPDIAMATASISHLSVQEEAAVAAAPTVADLDLGDGATHSSSSTMSVKTLDTL